MDAYAVGSDRILADVLEGDDGAQRDALPVRTRFLVAGRHVHVDAHIDEQVGVRAIQDVQERGERISIDPVVTVHHAKVRTGGMGQTDVDRGAVPAVLLADEREDIGHALHEALRDGRCAVLGAVIYHEDLKPAPEALVGKGRQAVFEIGLDVIGGNDDGQHRGIGTCHLVFRARTHLRLSLRPGLRERLVSILPHTCYRLAQHEAPTRIPGLEYPHSSA